MKSTKLYQCNLLLTALGSVITFVQIVLLLSNSDGICFNEGCEVVDNLTTISPVIINFLGLCFFQLTFWLQLSVHRGGDRWLGVMRLLLLAGMAVEGVLLSFQYLIVKTFCSYCLLIFLLILLANLCLGWRQLLAGLAVIVSIVMTFASLQLSSGTTDTVSNLQEGALAQVQRGDITGPQYYLFFSGSCPHCEKVIEWLDEGSECNISFNPIEKVALNSILGEPAGNYSPEVNLQFLTGLGLSEIPVLAVKEESGLRIIQGSGRILKELQAQCRKPNEFSLDALTAPAAEQSFDFLSPNQAEDDACSVAEDCIEPFDKKEE